MFRVKHKKTGKIYQVLDTHYNELYGLLMFLVWDNNDWRLRPSRNFVPPNYELETENEEKSN